MQWDDTKNLGFSTAAKSKLYLPVEARADGRTCANSRKQAVESGEIPTVSAQINCEDSFLSWVRALIALRHNRASLQAGASWRVLYAPVDGRGFAYERCAKSNEGESAAERSIVVMNPGVSAETVPFAALANLTQEAVENPLLKIGEVLSDGNSLKLGAQSFAVFDLPL